MTPVYPYTPEVYPIMNHTMAVNMKAICLVRMAMQTFATRICMVKRAAHGRTMRRGTARKLGAHLRTSVFMRAAIGPKLT